MPLRVFMVSLRSPWSRRVAPSARDRTGSRPELALQDGQLAGDLQHGFPALVLAAQEDLDHARLPGLSELRQARVVLGLGEDGALGKQGIARKDRIEVPPLVVAQLRDRVLLRLLRSEPGDEGKDDPAVDDALPVEGGARRVVAQLL